MEPDVGSTEPAMNVLPTTIGSDAAAPNDARATRTRMPARDGAVVARRRSVREGPSSGSLPAARAAVHARRSQCRRSRPPKHLRWLLHGRRARAVGDCHGDAQSDANERGKPQRVLIMSPAGRVVNFAPRVAGPVSQLCFDGSRRLEGANRLERGLGDEVSNFKYRKLVET